MMWRRKMCSAVTWAPSSKAKFISPSVDIETSAQLAKKWCPIRSSIPLVKSN